MTAFEQEAQIIAGVADRLNIPLHIDEPGRYILLGFELVSPAHPENQNDGKWELYTSTVIPGVWRTANGDGWPDDVDINLHGAYDKLEDALGAFGGLYVKGLTEDAEMAIAFDHDLAQDSVNV